MVDTLWPNWGSMIEGEAKLIEKGVEFGHTYSQLHKALSWSAQIHGKKAKPHSSESNLQEKQAGASI